MRDSNEYFWQKKSLEEMSSAEWESLCDRCGRCCLEKLEDDESGEVFYTNVACRLFDGETCCCLDYEKRSYLVKDCRGLTPENVKVLTWLPETCAYRLLAEGGKLAWWHPLISGSRETVHEAGISMRGLVVPEKEVTPEALKNHILSWKK